jgi:GT2 family glycosyltransferase
MIKPKVAIGIVNYNSPVLTINCLEQIRKQEYKNYEIIVLDNGSAEQHLKGLLKIKGITLMKNLDNQGYSGGANRIVEWSLREKRFEYLLMINNDVLIKDRRLLLKLISAAESGEDIAMVCPRILTLKNRIQEGGARIKGYLITVKKQLVNGDPEDFPKNMFYVESYSGCCSLIKLEHIRDFSEFFPEKYFCYYEDFEFCAKITKSGKKIAVVPDASIVHLDGATSKKRESDFSIYHANRNKFWTMKRHLTSVEMAIGIIYYFLIHFPKQIIWAMIYSKKPLGTISRYLDSIRDGLFTSEQEFRKNTP